MTDSFLKSERLIHPLHNFNTNITLPFEIGATLRIRKLAKIERDIILERSGSIHLEYQKIPKFCLEYENSPTEKYKTNSFSVISALRLLKPNLIGINEVIFPGDSRIYTFPTYMTLNFSKLTFQHGQYFLEKNEIEQFWKLLNKVEKGFPQNRISFSFDRFNRLYSTPNLHDSLLNYAVILESLFLTGFGEKSFRLCCYVTFTLANSENEAKEIWNHIETLYIHRSKIVHGEVPIKSPLTVGKNDEKTKVSLVEFTKKIDTYVRRAILRILEEKSIEDFQCKLKENFIKKMAHVEESKE